MSDHQNQASLISSVTSGGGDVTVHVHGDVHAKAGDGGASSSPGKVIGVQNIGHATFTYNDNATINVQPLQGSSESTTDCSRPSLSIPSTSMSRPETRNSKNIQKTTAAILTQGAGTTVVNNPTINIGGGSAEKAEVINSKSARPEPKRRKVEGIPEAHHQMSSNSPQHLAPNSSLSAVTTGFIAEQVGQVIIQGSPTNVKEENPIKRILQTIHENTWRKTHFSIGETFKRDKFPEPDFDVHPQMAESPNFYQGGHQVKDDDDDNDDQEPVSETGCQRRKIKIRKAKYQKHPKFTFEDDDDLATSSISAESLMKKIHEKDDKLGVLGVVAQAGAGKTTCMRRWARCTMQKSGMSQENEFTACEDSRFQLVHFIDLKSIEFSKPTSLRNILFQDLLEDTQSLKIAYKWLIRNQDKVVIFLDGLDQAQQIAEDDVQRVGHHDTANSTTLLYNLLSRNHLPGVRIVISSREHSATSLPEEAWFKEVITLTGFTEEDAKKLFNAITTDDQEGDLTSSINDSTKNNSSTANHNLTNFDKLTKTSSALVTFISIPAFLMFTAIVFNTYGSAPATVTDLMAEFIDTLQYSINILEHKRIWEVIHKLKQLSHNGMENGLVIFSENNLAKCDLAIKDIRDLLLMVPRSRSLSHHLIEGDNVFFFCHQILQEFLSACSIVEMSLSNFVQFVKTKLNEDLWSVVRRFVCGLIFAKSTNDNLLKISDKNEKQRILRESLASKLNLTLPKNIIKLPPVPLELYAAIYESNDDQLIYSISKIDLQPYHLTHNALLMIGLLMARSGELDCFEVDGDNNYRHLPTLTDCLKDSKVKIKKVNILGNVTDFSNLNEFIQNIDSGEVILSDSWNQRYDEEGARPDWSIIQRLRVNVEDSVDLVIVSDNQKGYESIKIRLSDVNNENSETNFGAFNKNDTTLKVDPSTIHQDVLFQAAKVAAEILEPSLVLFETEIKCPPLKLDYDDLELFQDYKVDGQVEDINLDCRSWDKVISYEKISPLVRQLHVKILTLSIGLHKINKIPVSLRHELHLLSCELSIRIEATVGFNNNGVPSLQELSTKLRGHPFQIDCLELQLACKISLEEFIFFINDFNSETQLWVYRYVEEYIGDDDNDDDNDGDSEDDLIDSNSWLTDTDNQELICDTVKTLGISLKIINRWYTAQEDDYVGEEHDEVIFSSTNGMM